MRVYILLLNHFLFFVVWIRWENEVKRGGIVSCISNINQLIWPNKPSFWALECLGITSRCNGPGQLYIEGLSPTSPWTTKTSELIGGRVRMSINLNFRADKLFIKNFYRLWLPQPVQRLLYPFICPFFSKYFLNYNLYGTLLYFDCYAETTSLLFSLHLFSFSWILWCIK